MYVVSLFISNGTRLSTASQRVPTQMSLVLIRLIIIQPTRKMSHFKVLIETIFPNSQELNRTSGNLSDHLSQFRTINNLLKNSARKIKLNRTKQHRLE